MVDKAISQLVAYGIGCGLLDAKDRLWAINGILELMELEVFVDPKQEWGLIDLPRVLNTLCDEAYARGLIPENNLTHRDLFDTKLMGRLTPRPSQVVDTFWKHHRQSPQKATDWFYHFSQATNYIRRDRIARDRKWISPSPYGNLDITINLSKPEMDPADIAKAQSQPTSPYPRCLLCEENEGYAGGVNHPARQHHRTIPITLHGASYFLQFSPYVYYNEHCIVISKEHSPMGISKETFYRLLDFVDQFPHYFLGANAGLPIVGGSILSHDHFQGGRYEFAMERAPIEQPLHYAQFPHVEAGTIRWPMAAIRLTSPDRQQLVDLADHILQTWRSHTDPAAFIFAGTAQVPHNTITPIARKKGDKFQLDLVFRNNITTKAYPLGVFHPHPELHHIKKENIGLIEVMGLAVLPARLRVELMAVAYCLISGTDMSQKTLTAKHAKWADSFRNRYTFTEENALPIIRQETGRVFLQTLEHAGVFKRTEEGQAAFQRFLDRIL